MKWNTVKSQSLAQRKVYCRAMEEEGCLKLQKYPSLPKGFQQSIFKSQVREESHSPLIG